MAAIWHEIMRFREADTRIMTQFKVGCQHLFKGRQMTKTSVTTVSRLRIEPGTTRICYLIIRG